MLKKEQFAALSLIDKKIVIVKLCEAIKNEDFSIYGGGFLDSVASDDLYQIIYNSIFDFIHEKKMDRIVAQQEHIKELQARN